MKNRIIFSLVFCLIFCFSACAVSQETYQFNGQGLPIISDNLRSKINTALTEKDPLMYFWGIENTWGTAEKNEPIRYYGHFEGYDIVFYHEGKQVCITGGLTIAGIPFSYSSPFAIVGYKDGILYDLNELYKEGKISIETIRALYQYHQLYDTLPRE